MEPDDDLTDTVRYIMSEQLTTEPSLTMPSGSSISLESLRRVSEQFEASAGGIIPYQTIELTEYVPVQSSEFQIQYSYTQSGTAGTVVYPTSSEPMGRRVERPPVRIGNPFSEEKTMKNVEKVEEIVSAYREFIDEFGPRDAVRLSQAYAGEHQDDPRENEIRGLIINEIVNGHTTPRLIAEYVCLMRWD